MKPRALRLTAETDIDRAFSYYLTEAGADTALGFLDEVETALSHLEKNPGTGSPRYGELCEVPGLRLWLVKRFPYAVLYVEQAAHLDVLRVLHQHADIPAQLADELYKPRE
jgi:toxin ParE1/3/4